MQSLNESLHEISEELTASDLTTSLQDGTLLLTLINTFCGDYQPLDEISVMNPHDRLKIAIEKAETVLNVPSLISVNDIMDGLDDLSMATYLSYFQKLKESDIVQKNIEEAKKKRDFKKSEEEKIMKAAKSRHQLKSHQHVRVKSNKSISSDVDADGEFDDDGLDNEKEMQIDGEMTDKINQIMQKKLGMNRSLPQIPVGSRNSQKDLKGKALPSHPTISLNQLADSEMTELWKQFLKTEEKVVYSSSVIKRTGMLGLNTQRRELIMTTLPRFLYVDSNTNKLKGTIAWEDDMKIICKSLKKFVLHTKIRNYHFEDLMGAVEAWLANFTLLKEAISRERNI